MLGANILGEMKVSKDSESPFFHGKAKLTSMNHLLASTRLYIKFDISWLRMQGHL
jgi:hypothetical protein